MHVSIIFHEFSSRSTRFSSKSRRVLKPEVVRNFLKSKVLILVMRSGPQLKSQPIAQLCRFFVNKTVFDFAFVYEKSLITEQWVEILIAVHIPKKPHHQFRLSRITCFSMKIANIWRYFWIYLLEKREKHENASVRWRKFEERAWFLERARRKTATHGANREKRVKFWYSKWWFYFLFGAVGVREKICLKDDSNSNN